jgi:hypothetical protein
MAGDQPASAVCRTFSSGVHGGLRWGGESHFCGRTNAPPGSRRKNERRAQTQRPSIQIGVMPWIG